MSIERLQEIWPEWSVEGRIGEGSYGKVYKAVHVEQGVSAYAAIKVISIPQTRSEIDSLRSEGIDEEGTRTYFESVVNDFVNEIKLMHSFKGIQNIVSVEDFRVVEKQGEIGWDIFIRMELLTPFNTYMNDKNLDESDIIRLGIDICTALEICGKRNIIHRDIKAENIFVNDYGYFKLGDFGIARKMENMTGGLSQKGTFNYMAPEVANSMNYDARVDIYSLGIVLYRLLNHNRLPFLDADKQLLSPNDRRIAVERRMKGEPLPPPCEASPAMADLILRACAFDPNQRFATASEMKNALMSVGAGSYVPVQDMDATRAVRRSRPDLDKTMTVRQPPLAGAATKESTFGKKSDNITHSERKPALAGPAPELAPSDSAAPARPQKRPYRAQILVACCALLLLGTGISTFLRLHKPADRTADDIPPISLSKNPEDGVGGGGSDEKADPLPNPDPDSNGPAGNPPGGGADEKVDPLPDPGPDGNGSAGDPSGGGTDSEKTPDPSPDGISPDPEPAVQPPSAPEEDKTPERPVVPDAVGPEGKSSDEPIEPVLSPELTPSEDGGEEIRLTPGTGGTYSSFLYLRFPDEEVGLGMFEAADEVSYFRADADAWFDTVTVTLHPGDDRITGKPIKLGFENGAGLQLTDSFQSGLTFEISAGTYQLELTGQELLDGPYIVEEDGTISCFSEVFFITVTFDHNGDYTIYLEN